MGNKELREYIMMMLGAPCVAVELDENQIDYAIKLAEGVITFYKNKSYKKNISKGRYYGFLKDLSLAKAKNILGRIRNNFIPPEGSAIMDGESLLAEYKEDMEDIEARLSAAFPEVPELEEDPIFLTALASVIVELPEDGWNEDVQTDEEIAERVVKYAKAVARIAREEDE